MNDSILKSFGYASTGPDRVSGQALKGYYDHFCPQVLSSTALTNFENPNTYAKVLLQLCFYIHKPKQADKQTCAEGETPLCLWNKDFLNDSMLG